jgi:hypothetical protein
MYDFYHVKTSGKNGLIAWIPPVTNFVTLEPTNKR